MAYLIKKLKNDTLDPITILGVVLVPGEYFEVPLGRHLVWAGIPEARSAITAGNLIVNDGTDDLAPGPGLIHFDKFPGDANSILNKTIDGTGLADNRILKYDASSGTWKLEEESVFVSVNQMLRWTVAPLQNGIIGLMGWNIQTDEDESLTSSIPVTASEPGYHSHWIFDISSASGLPFTLRITGRSINESTGVETADDTEDISVTEDDYYQSIKSWTDASQFSIVEASKSCTIDIYRNTYWDYQNSNFVLKGLRLEFEPDATTWSINPHLIKVENNGSLTYIDDTTLADTDTFPRADRLKSGKYKRGDYNETIYGTQSQGLIVEIDQTNIRVFTLVLNLTPKET